MADNYLEKQYELYQARKAAWEKSRKLHKKKMRKPDSSPVPLASKPQTEKESNK